MSEDKQVMDMVNEHAAKLQAEGKTVRNWKEQPLNADYIRTAELMGEEYIASRMEKRTVREAGPYNDRKLRAFLLMAVRVLLWLLAGAVILALMVSGQIAVWLAASCTCVCVVAAAIHVDRFFRKR